MPYMMICRSSVDNLWHCKPHDVNGTPLGMDSTIETRRIGGDQWCKPDPPKEELCPICFPFAKPSKSWLYPAAPSTSTTTSPLPKPLENPVYPSTGTTAVWSPKGSTVRWTSAVGIALHSHVVWWRARPLGLYSTARESPTFTTHEHNYHPTRLARRLGKRRW